MSWFQKGTEPHQVNTLLPLVTLKESTPVLSTYSPLLSCDFRAKDIQHLVDYINLLILGYIKNIDCFYYLYNESQHKLPVCTSLLYITTEIATHA